MLVAIHHRQGSFSERWIEYCQEHGVPYKIVNCYDSDIIARLQGADALLWHWSHVLPQDHLVAPGVLRAAECMGLKVFPDTNTCLTFDDKLAQKYLLESIGAPLVPTWAFFEKKQAIKWLCEAEYPLVCKLRRGAGSSNVRLVRTLAEAKAHCKAAFGRGIAATSGYLYNAKTRIHNVSNAKDLWDKLKRMILQGRNIRRMFPREKGYVLFQKFIAGNTFDTRVNIVGNRAWAQIRHVRPGDFRASGSGQLFADPTMINMDCVRIAFAISDRLRAQSMAYDFLVDSGGQPLITEMSYCYGTKLTYEFGGYWNRNLQWVEGAVRPQHAILEDLLKECGWT